MSGPLRCVPDHRKYNLECGRCTVGQSVGRGLPHHGNMSQALINTPGVHCRKDTTTCGHVWPGRGPHGTSAGLTRLARTLIAICLVYRLDGSSPPARKLRHRPCQEHSCDTIPCGVIDRTLWTLSARTLRMAAAVDLPRPARWTRQLSPRPICGRLARICRWIRWRTYRYAVAGDGT